MVSALDLPRKSFCFKWGSRFLVMAQQGLLFPVLFVSWSVLSGKEQKELYRKMRKGSPAGLPLPRYPPVWESLERAKQHKQWEDARKAALPNHPLLQSSMQEQNKLNPKPSKQEMQVMNAILSCISSSGKAASYLSHTRTAQQLLQFTLQL